MAILLNNNFEYKLNKIKKDREGNKIILDLSIKDKRITLTNIYGPNRDTPSFFEQISQDIKEFENDYVILNGDFNLIMDPDRDTKNYRGLNNPNAREKVLNMCAE